MLKVLVIRPLLEPLDHRNFKFQKSFSICLNISVSLLILHQPCWPQELCFQATIGSESIRCPANLCWWSGWRARATDSSTCRPASPFTGTSSSWWQNREIRESRFEKFLHAHLYLISFDLRDSLVTLSLFQLVFCLSRQLILSIKLCWCVYAKQFQN